jgi:hypothetical protein
MHSKIDKPTNSIQNKEELPQHRQQSLNLFRRKEIQQIIVITEAYRLYQLHQNFNQHPSVGMKFTCRRNY